MLKLLVNLSSIGVIMLTNKKIPLHDRKQNV